MSRLSRVAIFVPVFILILVHALTQSCELSAAEQDEKILHGHALAQTYCTPCHLLPDPSALTKTAWAHQIQPQMAYWLGLERFDYEATPDGKILLEAGVYPSSPIVPESDWFAIWDYYRDAAPSTPLPQPPKPPLRMGLKQFRARPLQPHAGAPMTSLVKIDSAKKQLYVGDAFTGLFMTLNSSGELIDTLRLGSAPVSVRLSESGLTTTLIGRIFPSDTREGSVLWIPRDRSTASITPRLRELRRPTDTAVADLNGDGRDDLVVCEFGHRLGRFSWFEQLPNTQYREHVLLDRPGAIRTEIHDFNGDGRPDIIVMMAQAREGIYLFLNEGQGNFHLETIVEQPPSFGFVDFQLADFDRDGHMDILACNGDNGDFALPLKSYHGVRIYRNDGHNHFREVWSYPMHGAYKAVARDFDGDGDLDIAAISFYPDFERSESFVYLENKGDWQFEASTCAEASLGRWLTLDAGDLDGDGDDDIVLGSFVKGPTTLPVPLALRERWRTNGAAVLVLENLRR